MYYPYFSRRCCSTTIPRTLSCGIGGLHSLTKPSATALVAHVRPAYSSGTTPCSAQRGSAKAWISIFSVTTVTPSPAKILKPPWPTPIIPTWTSSKDGIPKYVLVLLLLVLVVFISIIISISIIIIIIIIISRYSYSSGLSVVFDCHMQHSNQREMVFFSGDTSCLFLISTSS